MESSSAAAPTPHKTGNREFRVRRGDRRIPSLKELEHGLIVACRRGPARIVLASKDDVSDQSDTALHLDEYARFDDFTYVEIRTHFR